MWNKFCVVIWNLKNLGYLFSRALSEEILRMPVETSRPARDEVYFLDGFPSSVILLGFRITYENDTW